MPLRSHLGRLAQLATLPETRGLIVATVRSTSLRSIARRAVEDRGALLRDLADPANARQLALLAIRHPAVAELADAGLVFLPGRYMPLGWVATWATRRVFRRYRDPQVRAPEEPIIEAGPPPGSVAPEGLETERRREGSR
jgi:hypothetical protein